MHESKSEKHNDNKTFEDILKMVGTTGWKNILIIISIYYMNIANAIDAFSAGFLGKTPEFHCQNNFLQQSNWTFEQKLDIIAPKKSDGKYDSCQMYNLPYDKLYSMSYEIARSHIEEIDTNFTVNPCMKIEFKSDLVTTVTEWNLVCERRALYSTTQSAVQIGKLLGSLIFGYLSDKYGRKTTYNIATFGYIIFSFSVALSSGIWTFLILKIITATFGMGAILTSFVLNMEIILTHQRPCISCLGSIGWGLGLFYLAAVAYYVRTWYYLQILLTLPAIGQLFTVWYVPESPRWLIVNGEYDKSYGILKDLADSNKRIFPAKEEIVKIMKNIHNEHKLASINARNLTEEMPVNTCWDKVKKYLKSTFILICDRRFRMITFAVFYCWFAVAFVYFGISLGNPAPGTAFNEYAYTAIGGATELIMGFVPWFLLVYFGRKKTLTALFLSCSISILMGMVLIILKMNIEYIGVQWFLFVLGRLGITGAFTVVYLFTGELYPTSYRTMAIGQSSIIARLGSIFSSYVNDLLGQIFYWAPSAIFGTVSALSVVAILSLPETMHAVLPDFTRQKGNKLTKDNTELEKI